MSKYPPLMVNLSSNNINLHVLKKHKRQPWVDQRGLHVLKCWLVAKTLPASAGQKQCESCILKLHDRICGNSCTGFASSWSCYETK